MKGRRKPHIGVFFRGGKSRDVSFSGNNNTTTNQYQVIVGSAGGQKTLTYDLNGNCTSDGTRTYEWDAANRMVKITQGTHETEMTYDGLGRRVRIVEKENGTVVSDKRFVWAHVELVEERDGSGANVVKRFSPQGVQIVSGPNAGNYFWTRDHLGSVREMTDNSGSVRARYDYSPYGVRTKVSGDLEADFGFTGHYIHQPSDLALALYRVYDPELGRWLSREPFPIRPLVNEYNYSFNDPVNRTDPDGLWPTGKAGSPTVHQDSIDRVLPWLPEKDRKILRDQQVKADEDQSTAAAYQHAMRSPGETAAEAQRRANAYVRSEIKTARCLEAAGKHEEALEHLGNAIHTLQDSTSPMHAGFQVWGGISSLADLRKGLSHVKGEGYDPGYGTRLDWATRRAWQYFRGKRAMPADFFYSGEF